MYTKLFFFLTLINANIELKMLVSDKEVKYVNPSKISLKML